MVMLLDTEQITEYLTEIQERCRIIQVDNTVYVLKYPTEQTMNEGRILYAQLLAQLLTQGVPTRAEMRNLLIKALKAAGKDPEILERRQALMQKLADSLQETIQQEEVAKAASNVVDFMSIVDRAMVKLTQEDKQLMAQAADVEELELGLMGNCAEAISATQRDLYILSRCVYTAKNKNVWPDFDSINNEQDLAMLSDVADEFQRYLSGLPLVYEVELPSPEVVKGKPYPTQSLS